MKNSTLTPEQSLLLISKTIDDAKERFKENGHILVFWGILILIVIGSQFILSLLELYKFTMYPVYLYPLGGVYMIYIWIKEKKKNMPKTIIGNVLGNFGWVVGMNLLIMGFLFSNQLGDAMAPVFIILLALISVVSGLSIKFKPLTIGGVLLNLIGLGTFFLERDYQGFSMMLGSVVGLIIPGYYLILLEEKKMFKDLDPILHSQLRLSIISILMSVDEASFSFIKEETQATSGNLSIQIKKLHDAGYIEVKKTFKNNYPNTSLSITKKGIEAFENYVNNLKKYINPK